jgi:hypothetical protein
MQISGDLTASIHSEIMRKKPKMDDIFHTNALENDTALKQKVYIFFSVASELLRHFWGTLKVQPINQAKLEKIIARLNKEYDDISAFIDGLSPEKRAFPTQISNMINKAFEGYEEYKHKK